MTVNGQSLRSFIHDRWLPFVLTVLLSGGTGGIVAWATVPQRLDAMEVRLSNESTYLRGELRKLGIQVAHATCMAEASFDTTAAGVVRGAQRRQVCEEVDARVQDILEELIGR